jgi:hypothetical protein
VKSATCVDFAAGYDMRGPCEDVYGQEGEGGGGRGELDVGGGDEEAAFIEAVERLAVESGNVDAEGGMAQSRFCEDKLNAVSELAGWGSGTGGVLLDLGGKGRGEESSGQGKREKSPWCMHGGKFSRSEVGPA